MMVNVYSIKDTKAGAFLQPWFAANHAVAFRNCERSAKTPNTPFNEYPADFILVMIGHFDDDRGMIIPCEHEILGSFVQFHTPAPAADTAA